MWKFKVLLFNLEGIESGYVHAENSQQADIIRANWTKIGWQVVIVKLK